MDLEGVEYETVLYEYDHIGYKFNPVHGFQTKELTVEDIEILDIVIAEVGHLNAREIIG